MASGNLAWSSTSLSLTLPISCQICLGKVKEPVICPNQHVFCSTCMEVWLRSNQACPTCRTQITADRPCKKILGSLDLPVPSADHVTRTELRQTRLELIRQDFEDEISSLHKTVDRLQTENKQLYERLGEQDRQIAALELSTQQRKMKMGEGQGQSKTYPDMDILVKLTSKLQEASSTYEELKDDMNKTREENQKLREENTSLVQENTRIKQDSLFNRSPQKFGRYTVAALETKVSQYEREIQQLKKALVRSDHYIEELTRSEHNTPRISASQNIQTNILGSVTGTCTSTTPALAAGVDVPSSSLSMEVSSMTGLGSSVEVGSSQKIVKDEVPVLYCKNDGVTMETEEATSCIAGGRLNQPLPSSVCSSSSVTVALQNQNSFVRRESEAFPHSAPVSMVPCFEIPTMLNSPSFLPEKKESWLRNSPFNRSETALEGASAQGDLYPRVSLQDPAGAPLTEPTTSKGPNEEDELKLFPASKQLRLLSERIKRQRGESVFPAKAIKGSDHLELSPVSSDGACVMRTLDFDSEVGSVHNSESPRQGSLLEDHLQSTRETPTPTDSFSFVKIKIEVPDRGESGENPGPQKKVKTERNESNMET